jgi:Bacterial PH domain
MTERRFSCTPGGAILRGRRRLRRLLLGLAWLLVAVAALFWFSLLIRAASGVTGGGPWWPGLFALLAAAIPWLAWRMSGDLDLLWLALDGERLTIAMRRRRERFAAAGSQARRLTPEEISHLERLATNGGVTAGTGGFESHCLGELELYASDFANAVLVDLGETRLIVTPDDPQGFLEALSAP